MSAVKKQIHEGLRAELIEALGRHRYRLWFRDTTVREVTENELTLAVPTEVHRAWLQYTYGEELTAACERVLGPGTRITFEVSEVQDRKRMLRDRMPQRPEEWKALLERRRPAPTLDGYVVGRSGRFPVMLLKELLKGNAKADAVGLYLFGATGSGKTHLLRALEAEANRRAPGDAAYLTVRQFTNRYVSALRARDMEALRAFRKDLTRRRMIILDGVEELAARKSTQREVVALLDAVLGSTTRVVLAGLQHPAELDGLSPKLVSRLLGGVVVRLDPPRSDRLEAVLAGRASAAGPELPEDVCEAILSRTASVHGAVDLLDRWAALSTELGRPLGLEWLNELAPGATASASQEVIRRAKDLVASHFGIDRRLLDRPTKLRSAAIPRRLAIYLVYRACALPLVKLGEAFGLKSHSSVSRAIQEMRDMREVNDEIDNTIEGLLAQI